jgi:hypothetical protein
MGSNFGLEAKLPSKPYGIHHSEYRQFWFLWERETKPGQKAEYFRPFYSKFEDHKTSYQNKSLLVPIYYREETQYWYLWSFLFFFTGSGEKHDDQGDDEDFISPLFIAGKGNSAKENYIGLFPFFGNIRSKLSYQEIQYFMFPMYVSWRTKEYKSRSVLWPLTMSAEAPFRSEFRILPFYSKKVHYGKYERYSILWPFLQWGIENQDKKDPFEYGFYFPFFLYKNSTSGDMKSRSYLWLPILGSLFAHGYDTKLGHRNYNALFFVFQYGTSSKNDMEKFILFPFFGYSRYSTHKTRFFTPFYFEMKTDSTHLKARQFFFIPFYTYQTEEYPQTARTAVYHKLWPLFRYSRDSDGNLEWNTFTFFPLRQDWIEKVWDPIFSLVEYKRSESGEKQTSILFRLYTQRWSEEKSQISIPLIVEWESGNKGWKYEFLYGFLGIRSEEEKKTLKVLWFLEI